MVRTGSQAVFGEVALFDDDLAFQAGLLTAADRFELDPQLTRSLEQVCAPRLTSPLRPEGISAIRQVSFNL
jgi:hypothetical protein